MKTSRNLTGDHPRVAHRELEDSHGGALAGTLDEIVGDEPGSRLVVVRGADGKLAAYDEREIVTLGSETASSGPVLLRPRHLWNLMHRTPALLAVVFVLAVIVAVSVVAVVLDVEIQVLLAVFGAALLVSLIVLMSLQRELNRNGG